MANRYSCHLCGHPIGSMESFIHIFQWVAHQTCWDKRQEEDK